MQNAAISVATVVQWPRMPVAAAWV